MKTKLLTLFMALVATTALWAYDCEVDGIYYNLNSTDLTAEVTSGYSNSYIGSVVIPETVTYNSTTYSVTTIGYNAFSDCSGLTSVTIPNSVTTIGTNTFCRCKSLTSVIIPNSVTTIESCAFSGCSGLTSIVIPNSVTTIGIHAFSGCLGLTSPVYNVNCFAFMPISYEGSYCIPDGIKQIADGAFYDCSSLTSITIPNSVTTIGYDAFYGCSSLTSITIPNSVTTIGYDAFYNILNVVYNGTATGSPWGAKCVNGYVDGYIVYNDATKTKLCGCFTAATGEIIIPNSVTTIGDRAFYECSGLTSVTIGNSVTTIGDYAFARCSGLTSLTLPNSVTTIGDRTFYECSSLTSVTIGNSVTTIGEWAFGYCRGLTSVTIGNSVTTIGDDAFYGCSSLTSITIPNSVTTIGEEAFYMVNNIVYSGFATGWPWGAKCVNGYVNGYLVYSNASKTTLCGCSTAATGEIVIPHSVISIGNSAFYNCSMLTSVTIPNSVTTIGDWAFAWCSGLTSLILPNSVTTIGNYAFAYCSGLTSIALPFSTTAIEKYAFNNIYNLSIIYYNDKITELLQSIIGTRHSIDYRGVKAEITNLSPSTLSISNTANTDKDVIAGWKLNVNKQTYLPDNSDDILCTGLNPQTAYDCVQMIQLAGESEWLEDCHFSVTTPELTLTTLVPKVVSAGTAVVAAETNISDYETNVGFEWRKYDAPESMPSKSGAAILYNGMLEGKLLNLGTDSYWNVRPYYEAADGTRYYGEWITFDPSDFSYFEPTVHTYALATSPTANNVQVRGYVMTGTDDVTEQGFEYWFKGGQKAPHRAPAATPDSIYRVTASGQVMSAVLEDLAYSSTYTCRAYAIAGGKTYYGEEVQFLTPEDPRPIYTLTVIAGENGSVNTEASGQYREGEQVTLTATPNVGYQFEQWSDGNTENPYILTIMQDTEITATFKQAESGLTNLHNAIRATKYFHNGNLIIERNGIKYTPAGQKVK